MTLLGGTNVQSSAPEVRDMLERGVADAITFPWGSIVLFGIDKVVKYHMDVPLYVDDLRLGDEQGQVRRDVAGAEEGDRRPLHHRMGREGRRALGRLRARRPSPRCKAEPGHEVYKLTPEQLAEWRKAARAARRRPVGRQRARRPAAIPTR